MYTTKISTSLTKNGDVAAPTAHNWPSTSAWPPGFPVAVSWALHILSSCDSLYDSLLTAYLSSVCWRMGGRLRSNSEDNMHCPEGWESEMPHPQPVTIPVPRKELKS